MTSRDARACLCVAAITNHDEYSLIRELTDEEREKTLTLRRRDQKKMDEMKKKLHTDERKCCDVIDARSCTQTNVSAVTSSTLEAAHRRT